MILQNIIKNIPAWILFKNVNFTDIIDLYSFFKLEDKLEIAKEYCNNASQLKDEELVELLKNSITIVRKFRNRIAHNLKVITYRAKGNNLKLKNIKNFLPNQFIGKNDYKNKIGINDLFSMISSITFLLKNETLIFQMFSELKADFNLISLKKMVKKYKKVTNFPQKYTVPVFVLLQSALWHYLFPLEQYDRYAADVFLLFD